MTDRRLAVWPVALLLLAAGTRADEPHQGKDAPNEMRVVGKVVLLFDVSPSMLAVSDDLPVEGTAPEKMPSRQDKVIRLLTEEQSTFLKRLQEKGPLFLYRFGGGLDPNFVVFADGRAWSRAEWEKYQASPEPRKVPDGRPWAKADWESWLKPALNTPVQRRLFGTTNLGDSLVELLTKKADELISGLIVVSDGRSTEGNETAFRQIAEFVGRAKIPVFTVAVGEKRDRPCLKIIEFMLPEQVRPGEKFPVRVAVQGKELARYESAVLLDIYKPQAKEKLKTLEKTLLLMEGIAQLEFEIDPAADKVCQEEGEWRFVARVPRHKKEILYDAVEHVSQPETITVSKNRNLGRQRIDLAMSKVFVAGKEARLEARIIDKEGKPLPAEAKPEVTLQLPEGVADKDVPTRFTLKPVTGKPEWFHSAFMVHAVGQYTLTLKVKETGDTLTHKFTVEEHSPDMENVGPDLEQLYSLASSAARFTKHLDDKSRVSLRIALIEAAKPVIGDKEEDHLFFDLKAARLIPDCVVRVERRLKKP
jgi:hypothetical protein